jgi:excisionase family DNA binding protein
MKGKPQLDVLTPAEVAAQLRVSVDTVRELFRRGELEGFRAGWVIRILAASVVAFTNRHRNRPPVVLEPEPMRPRGRGKRAAGGSVYRHLDFLNQ